MTTARFNGEKIAIEDRVIPIEERGHNFGDGIYDVIRVYNSTPFMLEAHLDRIYQSADGIRLELKERALLKEDFLAIIAESDLKDCDLYFQATRGIAPRQHTFPDCDPSISLIVRPHIVLTEAAGITTMLHPDERWKNCHYKTLNLLPNILAKQSAAESGCFEAILVKDGYVTEGASTNVFIVKDDMLITTPLSNETLPGITRKATLEVARALGIDVVERRFTTEELLTADEAFLTGTLCEILPIFKVDEAVIGGGAVGPVTKKLQDGFWELVKL